MAGGATADSDARRALAAHTEGLRRSGTDPVTLLTGAGVPAVHRHYPAGDVYDMTSHAQFYWHSHRLGEVGHIHLFQRPRGMPRGMAPAVPAPEADAPSHLIAVCFDPEGMPDRLFTTNRWVTGEAWYRAADVKAMVAGLRLGDVGRHGAAAEWLACLVRFYRPLIETLLDERDAAVEAWRLGHPGRDALNDERLEITSSRAVAFAADLGLAE